MTRRIPRLAAAAVLGWAIAGCGSVTLSPTQSPSAPVPLATPAPTRAPAATPTVGAFSSGGTVIAIDPGLLAILPATVGGRPLGANPEGEAAARADPILAHIGLAAAAALALDPASGDFVYAVVVRLRPGALTDETFRDWRDSFDEGACSQAGGVVGRAETEIAGRTVYIGSCEGGLRTYHVRLVDREVLISASAAGELRLGEQLVENLRP